MVNNFEVAAELWVEEPAGTAGNTGAAGSTYPGVFTFKIGDTQLCLMD